ncbi:MAG: isoprenylcysteine carboxylmethyltransferase family protein [Acidobacteriota bacterium]
MQPEVMIEESEERTAKRTSLTVAAFYALIAFEFFYMASPFAAYFYAGYLPGLKILQLSSVTARLTGFFLPHLVTDTSSFLVNSAPFLGAFLTAVGLAGFAFGAVQIYSRKLRKMGAATGGVYKVLRHPQYASLIVAGAGLLLLWPRNLMAVLFVTMLFVYTILARIEEQECLRLYGDSYRDYMMRVPGILPVKIPLIGCIPKPRTGVGRVAALLVLYVAAQALTLATVFAVQNYTIAQLHAVAGRDSVYVALDRVEASRIRDLAGMAETDPGVRSRLSALRQDGVRFVNYVMPQEWAVSEIQMNGPRTHETPAEYNRSKFKIIYTRAILPAPGDVSGQAILKQASGTRALFEAWVGEDGQIEKILEPPAKAFYGDVPVPVY